MSRRRAAIAAFIGVTGGAIAGSPYLDDTGPCVADGGTGFQCAMNEAIGPIISAVAIGFCVAILIAHVLTVLSRRLLAPRPAGATSRRAAVEVDDACLEIAAWGRAPGESAPVLAVAAPLREPTGELGSRGRPVPRPHRAG